MHDSELASTYINLLTYGTSTVEGVFVYFYSTTNKFHIVKLTPALAVDSNWETDDKFLDTGIPLVTSAATLINHIVKPVKDYSTGDMYLTI
jgi:hypothetical protein